MITPIKKRVRFIISTVLLLGLLVVFAFSWDGLSPAGKILDPVVGVYTGGQGGEDFSNVEIEGLKGEVSVYYDERSVPHIFAENDQDLYASQGFVEASDRLWQMEFLAYSTSGRLSEVMGATYLDYDREIRRKGLLLSAQNSLKLIEKDQETYEALLAYTRGVNAFIHTLTVEKLPLEYKLLGYAPEEWTPLKSVLIMKSMGRNLSELEKDVALTQLYHQLGSEDFDRLFPAAPYNAQGIASLNKDLPQQAQIAHPSWATSFEGIGSNAWAVQGKKTASGNPILCMDPHLNLSYPSVWYEIELRGMNHHVHGVSIPGVPGVIMGFNDEIAFCTTNGQADVKDWYLLDMTDSGDHYLLDGKKVAFKYRTETFTIKGGGTFVDTIKYALQGPVVFEGDFTSDKSHENMALSWELHNESNDIRTFLKLNKAKNKKDFVEAVKGFSCPTQNFLFVDKTDQIALIHQGRLRANRIGNGRFIIDGSKAAYFTKSYIHQDSLPFYENSPTGVFYSTNQIPDTTDRGQISYGYYANVRNQRLEELLLSPKRFSMEDMKRFQKDNLNVFARQSLRKLVSMLEKTDVSKKERATIDLMKSWDYRFNGEDKAPLIFDIFWKEIQQNLYSKFKSLDVLPDQYVSLNLLHELDSSGMKSYRWSKYSSVEKLMEASFRSTLDSLNKLEKELGVPPTWGTANPIVIGHMTNLGAFGDYHMKSNGHKDVLNAVSANWGPSWRMIIEMGKKTKAFGVFPGGEQGDPRNKKYDAFTQKWYEGEYYELISYASKDEAKRKSKHIITMHGTN